LKPVIFLDIDGVVNVIPPRKGVPPHLKVWNEWRKIEVRSYPINYSPDLIEHLNRLSEKADIIWLTTWRSEAVKYFAPAVGLNEFKFLNHKGMEDPWGTTSSFSGSPENRWWKMNAVMHHIDTIGTPFVWIDDELRSSTKRYVRGIAEDCNIPNLMFIPFDTLGIDREHIERIDEFITSL
jgi:hypothetical protein